MSFLDSMMFSGADGLFPVCNTVWCLFLTRYMSIHWNRADGCLFYAAFGVVYIAAVVACTGVLLSFFVMMADDVMSAVIVSYTIVEKGTSVWGCFKASVMS